MQRADRRSVNSYNKSRQQYRTKAYVDGNTARQLQMDPSRTNQRNAGKSTSMKTRRNREKALQMNPAYVVFLTLAAAATLFVCVNFLKFQAENTTYKKNLTTLNSQLSELKLANNTKYEETMASINLAQIKEKAMNEFGMVYANEGQIITYNTQDGDYLRQYGDVPTDK